MDHREQIAVQVCAEQGHEIIETSAGIMCKRCALSPDEIRKLDHEAAKSGTVSNTVLPEVVGD